MPPSRKETETETMSFYHKYVLLNSKGSGSFGQVFLAVDKFTGHKVIVKNIVINHDHEWEDDFFFTSKTCEIGILERLQRLGVPDVPRILDYGFFRWNTTEIGYMVMEDTNSTDFFHFIQYSGRHILPLAEADVMRIFARIFHCVYSAATYAGVYHGDLKTGNVITDPSLQNIQVIDWGSVHLAIEGRAMHRTCTTEYASPESLAVVTGKNGYDPELLLVWSLGTVLYELVTGTMFYDKKEATEYYKIGVYYYSKTNLPYPRTAKFQDKLYAKIDAGVKSSKINRLLRLVLRAKPNERCKLDGVRGLI